MSPTGSLWRLVSFTLCVHAACGSAGDDIAEEEVDWTVAFSERSERRKKRQKYALHIPRVTSAELAANETLLSGHLPFVVTDAMDGWAANAKWQNLDYLVKRVPDEWVDYYKANMYTMGDKPYLFRLKDAAPQFRQASETGKPRYMQLRLGLKGWKRLKKDLGSYMPPAMWTEEAWIDKCMPQKKDIDNFYRVNQWNMLLIGETGTGIFFHHDHLAASSWQAHVVGRKAWVVCPYSQGHLLHNELHAWDPDYTRFPNFKKAVCGRVIAAPGELLYYPAYWWHTTKILDPYAVGVTGLMVGVESQRRDIGEQVHRQFHKDLQRKCANPGEDISLKWPGAAPPISPGACAALNDCLKLWEQHYNEIGDHYTTENPYADHVAEAKRLFYKDDVEGAIVSLSAAVHYHPEDEPAWSRLKQYLKDSGNPDLGSPRNDKRIGRVNKALAALAKGDVPFKKKNQKQKSSKRKAEL